MNKLAAGLINVAFFVAGDLAYSLFRLQDESRPWAFFGFIIIVLMFFVLHKLDNLLDSSTSTGKLLKEKRYTNWLASAVLGLGFAFSSSGSTLLRWIS